MNKPRGRKNQLLGGAATLPTAIVNISNLAYDTSWVPYIVRGDFELVSTGGGKISQGRINDPLIVKEEMNITFTITDPNFYFCAAPRYWGDGRKNKQDKGGNDFEPQGGIYGTSVTIHDKYHGRQNRGDYSWKMYMDVVCPDRNPGTIDPDIENDN